MSYYKVLGLEAEPFSSSPDPNFFYLSTRHNTALKRLEINIRLRRGLSLILGDIGTGKTTLSRALLQAFQNEDDFIFHIILDPGFESHFFRPCFPGWARASMAAALTFFRIATMSHGLKP